MTFDDDAIRRSLRHGLDRMEIPRDLPAATVQRARKRRFTGMAAVATLAIVALIGSLAGAGTLLGDRAGMDAAPAPQDKSECVPAGYDLVVFVPRGATETEVTELGDRLEADSRVAAAEFVKGHRTGGKGDAASLPPHTEDRYGVNLEAGVDPDPRLLKELDLLGAGAYFPSQQCPEERSARCGFPTVRPTYLPWLGKGERPGAPIRSYDEEIDRAQLSWQRDSASVGLSVYPEDLDATGERIGVRVEGAEGHLHRGEGGSVSASWDLPEPCDLLELSIHLPGASDTELKRELIKVARSFERPSENSEVPEGFHSIEDAVAYLEDGLDMPVALPNNLPDNIRLNRRPVSVERDGQVASGRLELRFATKGILIFDFGKAGFDGCGGDDAVEVDINGTTGLMLAKDRYPWTQIIWPAKPGDRQATYGIYGSLPGDKMLELARAMDVSLQKPGAPAGC